MKNSKRKFEGLLISIIVLLLAPLMIVGQGQKSSLTGKYEGTAKGPNGDVQVTLDLKDSDGKFSGHVTTASDAYDVVKGQMIDGLLTLDVDAKGSTAKLAVRQKDDKLVGELTAHGQTGAIELRRVPPDDISGQWDGTADANGQPFPFLLTLKVDGEKVTGASSSDLGTSTITNGSWKDGKLVFVLDSANGQIGMVATIVDGKLVGDFDLSGQMTGKWAAVKKKQ